MNYFTTTALMTVLQSLKRPQSFLLDRFFPKVMPFDTEEVTVDIQKGKRRIAPLVSPLVAGKVVQDQGVSTRVFKTAYVKDKRRFDPNRAFKRALGETVGGNMPPAERLRLNIVASLADQLDMLARRQEVMAAEALRRGKILLKGEGFADTEVDFQRAAGLTKALAGGDKWDQANSDPLAQIEDWGMEMLQESGAPLVDVVMDKDSWVLFRNHAKVAARLDRLANAGQTPLEVGTEIKAGGQFKGALNNINYWVYSDWYINDAGNEVPVLPSGTVLLGSPLIEGTRLFGAIQDEEAGLQPVPYHVKSWVENDPSVRWLLLQSAPLPVPTRIDASGCVTVK